MRALLALGELDGARLVTMVLPLRPPFLVRRSALVVTAAVLLAVPIVLLCPCSFLCGRSCPLPLPLSFPLFLSFFCAGPSPCLSAPCFLRAEAPFPLPCFLSLRADALVFSVVPVLLAACRLFRGLLLLVVARGRGDRRGFQSRRRWGRDRLTAPRARRPAPATTSPHPPAPAAGRRRPAPGGR